MGEQMAKRVSRPRKRGIKKRTKFSPEHRQAISEGTKKWHARRKAAGITRQKIKRLARTEKKDEKQDTFDLAEVKRNLVVFTITPDERPIEIGLDFRSETITVSIPNVPDLTSNFGFNRDQLKGLLAQLMGKHSGKIVQRVVWKKKTWKKRKPKDSVKSDSTLTKGQAPQDKKIKQVENVAGKVRRGILKSIREGHWDQERP